MVVWVDELQGSATDHFLGTPAEDACRRIVHAPDHRALVLVHHRESRADAVVGGGRVVVCCALPGDAAHEHAVAVPRIDEVHDHGVLGIGDEVHLDVCRAELDCLFPRLDSGDEFIGQDELQRRCVPVQHCLSSEWNRCRDRHEQAVRTDSGDLHVRVPVEQRSQGSVERFVGQPVRIGHAR